MYVLACNMTVYLFLMVYYVCIDQWLTAQTSYSACAFILLTLSVLSIVFPYNIYLISHNQEKLIAKNAVFALVVNILLVSFCAFLLDLPYQYCMIGTLIANILYVFMTGYQALKLIYQEEGRKCSIWRYLVQIFPFSYSVPFLVVTILLCYVPAFAGCIAFVLLIVLNWKQLVHLFRSAIDVIRNPNILNIN
jgi:hypothetical protein